MKNFRWFRSQPFDTQLSINPDEARGLEVARVNSPSATPFRTLVLGTTGVVLTVTDKQAPTDQDFAAKKDAIRDGLLQSKQNELIGAFIGNLRQQMQKEGKIRTNEEEMKNLTKGQASGL